MTNRRSALRMLAVVLGARALPGDAQQPAIPVVGFLRSTPSAAFPHVVAAFRDGLKEAGFEEGRNVAIEYRYADNHLDRLPAQARELVLKNVAVIVGNSLAADAARTQTSTIPIVFVTADDPVQRGLVASLGRPGGNLTGVTFFGAGMLGAKRFELLHELVPHATTLAMLADAAWPPAANDIADAQAAARTAGRRLLVVRDDIPGGVPKAFATFAADKAGGLIVAGSPKFTSRRGELIALAQRYALPAIYDQRDYVDDGGLMSYGGSLTAAYRQAGVYAGRMLKGANPAELPVVQPTTFGLVINLKTARALKLDVPPALRLRAEAVVE